MDVTGFLNKIYVHKNYQYRGVATDLAKELVTYAQKTGVFIYLCFNNYNLSLKDKGYIVERE